MCVWRRLGRVVDTCGKWRSGFDLCRRYELTMTGDSVADISIKECDILSLRLTGHRDNGRVLVV